jgi:hypothetical protein
MAALTGDKKIKSKWMGRSFTGDVAAATTIHLGALLAVNAAGFIVPASDIAAIKVVGVAGERVENPGAAGAKQVHILTGVFAFVNLAGAILQASKHRLCYVGDDQSVTTAAIAAQDVIAGVVEEFTTTEVWVSVGPEYGALG